MRFGKGRVSVIWERGSRLRGNDGRGTRAKAEIDPEVPDGAEATGTGITLILTFPVEGEGILPDVLAVGGIIPPEIDRAGRRAA